MAIVGWRTAPVSGTMEDMAVSDTTHARGSQVVEPRRPRVPHQALFAVAAGFVVVAIALTVLALNRGASPGPSTLPPATTPTAVQPPTTAPSPSSTPTSAEDKAAIDATDAYVAYVAADNQLARDGGAKASEAKMLKLTTKGGTERPYIKGYAKSLRDGKFRLTAGSSKVTSRVNAIELGAKPPRVDLTACLDQRSVNGTRGGKPFKPPQWLRYSIVMHLVDGKWLVDQVENPTADLDPQELTSCEP